MMNIITFVSTLLLILSLSSYTFLEKRKAHEEIKINYIGHSNALHKVQSKYTSKVFARIPKVAEKNAEKNASGTTKKKKRPSTTAKINIFHLIKEGKQTHLALYEIFAHLLRSNYAMLLDQKDLEYQIIDHMIEWGQKSLQKQAALYLEKISLEDLKLQQIFYLMLKGSKFLSSGVIQYPSLLDLVEISSNNKICVYLPYAHYGLIRTLFNEDIAQAVEKAQDKEEGFSPLNRQEFEQILIEKSFAKPENFDPMAFITFVRPQYHRSPLIIIEENDETSHISLKKMMYL